MKKAISCYFFTLLVVLFISSPVFAVEKQVVAGAGPSTKIVEQFFSKVAQQPFAQGYEFVVPPMSTKHAGGISNSDSYLFGRTGRPLNKKERDNNKKDIFLAKVPISFASGDGAHVTKMSLDDIKRVFLGDITNWKELGGPDIKIVRVGREQTEALFSELKEEYPFFQNATFDVIFKKDDEVVNFLKSPVGEFAIAFGAKPNFSEVSLLDIQGGFQAGVRVGLVFDEKNADHPLVKNVAGYAASREWKALVAQLGLIPVGN